MICSAVNTCHEAERVFNQLETPLANIGYGVEKAFQGSATNRTNIRHYSDVDLLLVTRKFYTLKPPLLPIIQYDGNPIDDLWTTRVLAADYIGSSFLRVKIDGSGSKSLKLSEGSL